jgi:UrcA family protein
MHKSIAALAALIATPAFGQGESPIVVEGGAPTAVVSYADLDLGSNSGLVTLNGRISRAASRLCTESGRTDLATQLNETRCFRTAVASAGPQIDRAVANQARQFASSGTIKVAAR